mmetsp:Transcript_143190/g.399126  ORF Transcript_143190/g.399126 Transcript_143190/m.399126 type:complete len:264 (+) Transcript_143190:836-1627(+)
MTASGLGAQLELVLHLVLEQEEADRRHQHLPQDLPLDHAVGEVGTVDLLHDGPRFRQVVRPPLLLRWLFRSSGVPTLLYLIKAQELHEIRKQSDMLTLRWNLELVAHVAGSHVIAGEYLVLLHDCAKVRIRCEALVEPLEVRHLPLLLRLDPLPRLLVLLLCLLPRKALLHLLRLQPGALLDGGVRHDIMSRDQVGKLVPELDERPAITLKPLRFDLWRDRVRAGGPKHTLHVWVVLEHTSQLERVIDRIDDFGYGRPLNGAP